MTEQKTLRPLFWAVMFLTLSINLNFMGLSIDFLPDIVGFCVIFGLLGDFREVCAPRPLARPIVLYGGIASLRAWLPLAWSGVPEWLQVLVNITGLLATIVAIRAVLHLIEALGHVHSRPDIADNAARLRRLYTRMSLVLIAAVAYLGELSGGALVFYLIINLAIAAFAANADLALFGEKNPESPHLPPL